MAAHCIRWVEVMSDAVVPGVFDEAAIYAGSVQEEQSQCGSPI
jgi:hypothetical protein